MKKIKLSLYPGVRAGCAALLATGLATVAHGQLVISDTLTGASSSYDWRALNGACLTAGNNTGTVPACQGLSYYSGKTQVGGTSGRLPDTVGNGALRLTNGDTTTGSNGDNQTGAVVSNFTFPTNQGLDVTFKTATYGGDAYGDKKTGADGISFFLADGAYDPTVGGLGGSLGYSCSNVNAQYDGVAGGYIGVGIDEFGNFSYSGDNTDTGVGYIPGRISVRAAGNTNFAYLSKTYPTYYPSNLGSSDKKEAVQNTCRTGTIWNYSGKKVGSIANKSDTKNPLALNYRYLEGSTLPSDVSISNQQATSYPTRGNAKPITYGLRITQDGYLSLSYSVNGGTATTVINNRLITQSNGPLPSSFRFGFSAGTGGGSNVHEIMCFKAAQINSSSSSAGLNVQQSAKVQVGTQLYLAYYHPKNWWGQLTAQDLLLDAATDTVSINPVANWDASCVLSGGSCSTTGKSNTAQASAARNLITWNGTAGIPLQWGSLTADQKAALDPSAANATTSDRLNYLRGVRTNEIQADGSGKFRGRDSVLGDIINSSPTWVGAPSSPYASAWADALYPSKTLPEGTSYATFASNNATRPNVVYAGANDGFLHAFRAGAYNADGTFDTTAANDGRELFAYMPARVIQTIYNSSPASLDFSSPQYAHNAYVDATPGTGDLYYSGGWHTWVVGGLGAGGNSTGVIGDKTSIGTGAIFALDVTNPSNFSESTAGSVVIGEWNSTSTDLICAGDTTSSKCRDSLGSTYGTPIIRRLHDGNWAVIFGNGLNSSTGKAGIFIMTVDRSTGSRSFRFLATSTGPATSGTTITARNGIVQVASADLDGDHITDYIYAGDVRGNLWRFDLTSDDPSNWAARTTPLFATPSELPITTRPTVTAALSGNSDYRVVVSFGTGQILPQTQTSAASPASGTQYLYGIWDWDMSAWNAKSNERYASLTGTQTVSVSTLQTQTATTANYSNGNISGVRTVTQNPVCWKGSSVCSSGNTQFGWKLALPGTNEQVIYNPILTDGLFVVNTTLPEVNQVLSCDTQPASGFTMAISPDTGGAPASSYFADATNNIVVANGAVVAGIGLSGVGSPSIVSANKKKYLATQTVSGTGSVTQVNPGANSRGQRVTWIKLR